MVGEGHSEVVPYIRHRPPPSPQRYNWGRGRGQALIYTLTHSLTHALVLAPTVQCSEQQFACLDGLKCIPKSHWCDYSPDCLDASDEPQDCRKFGLSVTAHTSLPPLSLLFSSPLLAIHLRSFFLPEAATTTETGAPVIVVAVVVVLVRFSGDRHNEVTQSQKCQQGYDIMRQHSSW